jgi:hypothetical protein
LIKDLSVISIEDGFLLGLRFRYDGKMVVTDIIGSEALDEPGTLLVQGFSETDHLVRLPSLDRLSDTEIALERRIHMLAEKEWHSGQTSDILLHQFRPNLRSNMVSPLTALAALHQDLGVGVSYQSKYRDIFLNAGSIQLSPDITITDVQVSYHCGAEASRERNGSSEQARLLRFEDLSIELGMAVRQELAGLGHLFALTVGAAMHVVKTADLHTH